jgi:hypothetical protein
VKRKVIAAVVLSASALCAQTANGPKLPVINKNACPFECCQFGTWTANQDVPVYDKWQREGRTQTFTVKKGEAVTAVTGVHITYKPGRVRVTKDVPRLHLRKGAVVQTFMSRGEGAEDFWANGRMQSDETMASPECSEPHETFSFCRLDDGDKDWWIQIKTKSGQTGWVQGNEHFDGTDACG